MHTAATASTHAHRDLDPVRRVMARVGLGALQVVCLRVGERRSARSGVALLMVLSYVAIMSAMVVSSLRIRFLASAGLRPRSIVSWL